MEDKMIHNVLHFKNDLTSTSWVPTFGNDDNYDVDSGNDDDDDDNDNDNDNDKVRCS